MLLCVKVVGRRICEKTKKRRRTTGLKWKEQSWAQPHEAGATRLVVRADRQEPKVRGEVAVGSVEEGKGRVGSSCLYCLVVVVVVVVVAAALLLCCPSRLFFLLLSLLCDNGDSNVSN